LSQVLRTVLPLPRLISPREVFAGEGTLAALRSLPATRVAVFASDRGASAVPVAKWLGASNSYEVRRLKPSWKGEPKLAELETSLGELETFQPDWIVAIGGGSVLDGGKLCWARFEHPQFPIDRLARAFSLPALRTRASFAAVPTTAGSGSEASSTAIYTEPETGRKIPVVSHEFMPDVVVLDPRLLEGHARSSIVAAAYDAIAHALEGLTSTLPNPIIDAVAEDSATRMIEALRQLLATGETPTIRREMQLAAYWAGHVQNSRLVGLAHIVAHQLGDVGSHADLVGVMLPASLRHSMRNESAQLALGRVASRLGLGSAEALIAELDRLRNAFGVSARLRDASPRGLAAGDSLESVAKRALDDPIARFLPVPTDPASLALILREVW
jgi:alcohol dehydrogenase